MDDFDEDFWAKLCIQNSERFTVLERGGAYCVYDNLLKKEMHVFEETTNKTIISLAFDTQKTLEE